MLATLKVIHGNNVGREYHLTEQKTLLGRGRECRIVIDDGAASRKHAQIVLVDKGFVIEDLKSTNHTFVNGVEIEAQRPKRLTDQDRIRIGETHLLFRMSVPDEVEADESDFATVLSSVDASPGTDVIIQGNAQAKLRAILQISQALGQTLDLDVLLHTMLDGLFEIFPNASRALVLLCDGQRLVPRAVFSKRDRGDRPEGRVQYSKTIVARALRDRQAILSQDAANDERFASTESVNRLGLRSVMCVPLVSREMKALGVIQLETQDQDAPFTAGDVQILAGVAVQVSFFLEYARLHDEILHQSRLERELELAEQVQQNFLPQRAPNVPGYRFWAYYAAAGKVGGDYYDFLALPNGNWAVLLADVSGKGVPAALRMARASTMCKVALLSHPDDVSQAVAAVNCETCQTAVHGGFITLVLCVLNPRTHELTLANAGHPAPLFCSPGGEVVELGQYELTGLPLGIEEDQTYPTSTTTIGPGDLVVLFSDGISEAASPEGNLFSRERICQVVAGEYSPEGKRPPRAKWSPTEAGSALIESVRRHMAGGEQTDDISLVVFGRSE